MFSRASRLRGFSVLRTGPMGRIFRIVNLDFREFQFHALR
jgi:hypothetical protein